MAMPPAPQARAATRPRPSVNPPAPSTGMSTASTTWGSSSEVGTDAGVAAALGALGDDRVDAPLGHLLGVAAGAHGGHGDDAGVLELGDDVAAGRLGERRHRHPLADQQVEAVADVGLIGAQVDPEGLVGAVLDVADGAPQLGVGHGGRGQDAQRRRPRWWPRSAGRRPPSPCRSARWGSSTPNSSHTRVCSAAASCADHLTDLGLAGVVGVEHLADQAQLVVGGQAALVERRRRPARSRWPRPPRPRSRPGAPSAGACGGRAWRSRTCPGW